tara:strand:- start:707 stop:1516 length:810 start_codon:yes stop_codon:yes gene_type:complete
MKMKHNKKRNTAFIYEVLINELSKSSMNNLQEKKHKIINILKSFFSKGTLLKEELEIYQSFNNLHELDEKTIQKIIFEARDQALRLKTDEVSREKSKIINLINKDLGKESWDTFVKNFKKMATINQTIFLKTSPKKQVFLEQKLIQIVQEALKEKKQFPNVNKLALNNFLSKFNNEYSNLNENQKKLLNFYITSYKDNGIELKTFLYGELDRLREDLSQYVKTQDSGDKIKMILERIDKYSETEINKNTITEVIKIQSLLEELNNAPKA